MSTSIRFGIGKTAVIFPAAFFIAISLGMVMLGSVFLLKELYQASPIQNALAPAIFHAVYVFACLFFRPLFDRLPVRYPLILSTLSMGLFTTLIVFSNNLWQVYLFFALYGLSVSLFWPPLMGWVSTGLEGKQLSSTLGKYNQCWSCGAILSPFVAGWLSEYNGYFPLIGGAAVMFMTLFLILGAIMVLPTVRKESIHEAFLATGLVAGLFFGNLIYQHASSFYVYTVCGVVILGGLLLQSWVSKHINASQ